MDTGCKDDDFAILPAPKAVAQVITGIMIDGFISGHLTGNEAQDT